MAKCVDLIAMLFLQALLMMKLCSAGCATIAGTATCDNPLAGFCGFVLWINDGDWSYHCVKELVPVAAGGVDCSDGNRLEVRIDDGLMTGGYYTDGDRSNSISGL
ncbi:hypothetical protein BX667DRAFT_498651 [Coemansia mojavensis]|nr:hypothetical protein BX667DRAFT_498651 [Coemansia mojavensis]